MRIKEYGIIICLLLSFCGTAAYAQELRTEIAIDFRVNRTDIDPNYGNNAVHLEEIRTLIENLRHDSTIQITEVAFCGAASPEGSYQLNRRLAHERLTALEHLVRRDIEIPDSIITRNDSYIPWHSLREQISESDFRYRLEVLAILDADSSLVDYHRGNQLIDRRVKLLQQLDQGKAWPLLLNNYFNRMRNASAIFITYKKKMQPEQARMIVPTSEDAVLTPVEIRTEEEEEPSATEKLPWRNQLYVKTNALTLAAGIANLAVEADIVPHWSFTLPVYYSAWDYFKATIKFRTFAIQPELRYWLSRENVGWFAGAHFGLAYYNFALDGDYRYQDHKETTPAVGGGIGIGYRMPINRNNRWHMEFSLGAGFYTLHYDKYYNTPVTSDGLMVESKRTEMWGIDQAAVTFSYSFDFKKKGGKR